MIGVGNGRPGRTGPRSQTGHHHLAKRHHYHWPEVAKNFYDPRLRPGQEPPPPPDLFDKQSEIHLVKWDNDGNEIRKTSQLTRGGGLIKETRGESDWSIYMRLDDVKAINEWTMGKRINYNKTATAQASSKWTRSIMSFQCQRANCRRWASRPSRHNRTCRASTTST